MTEKHQGHDYGQGYEGDFETATKGAPESGRNPKGGGGVPRAFRELLEFVFILGVAFALVFFFVRPYVVEAFSIPSESMVPTLEIGDRVLVNKFIYRFQDPEPGDVVVFKSVEGPEPPQGGGVLGTARRAVGLERDPRDDLIKRIVATGGDTVEVRSGTLFVNGEPQDDPFVNPGLPDTSSYGPRRVPEGEFFMMGDNRANSRDSRYFGTVPRENLEGEAFVRFWPPSRIGAL
jgi:signal peptidase I